MKRRAVFAGVVLALAIGGLVAWQSPRLLGLKNIIAGRMREQRTMADVVAVFGPSARSRLRPAFEVTGAEYPPASVTLVGLKAERRLEVWVPDRSGNLTMVVAYPVMSASGGPGPKLREGDRQVPEGLYPITFLNANSAYHLSLRVGYPSAEDRALAAQEGRSNLGGDIMIHGAGGSAGCLALSNQDVEDVFILAADVGIANVQAIIAPHDMRGLAVPSRPAGVPLSVDARYQELYRLMAGLVR